MQSKGVLIDGNDEETVLVIMSMCILSLGEGSQDTQASSVLSLILDQKPKLPSWAGDGLHD